MHSSTLEFGQMLHTAADFSFYVVLWHEDLSLTLSEQWCRGGRTCVRSWT